MKNTLLIFLLVVLVGLVLAGHSIPLPGGREFYCYIGSEGPNCNLRLSPKAREKQEAMKRVATAKYEAEFNRNFTCRQDSDCAIVGKGECAIKGSDIAKNLEESDNFGNKCKCMTGPVMFGCVTEQYYKLYTQ